MYRSEVVPPIYGRLHSRFYSCFRFIVATISQRIRQRSFRKGVTFDVIAITNLLPLRDSIGAYVITSGWKEVLHPIDLPLVLNDFCCSFVANGGVGWRTPANTLLHNVFSFDLNTGESHGRSACKTTVSSHQWHLSCGISPSKYLGSLSQMNTCLHDIFKCGRGVIIHLLRLSYGFAKGSCRRIWSWTKLLFGLVNIIQQVVFLYIHLKFTHWSVSIKVDKVHTYACEIGASSALWRLKTKLNTASCRLR